MMQKGLDYLHAYHFQFTFMINIRSDVFGLLSYDYGTCYKLDVHIPVLHLHKLQ